MQQLIGTNKFTTTNCPSCGAPSDITTFGICKHCKNVITNGNYDWILSEKKPIKK